MTAVAAGSFLPDADAKRWRPGDSVAGFAPQEFFVGRGSGALEVAWATASTRPTFDKIRKLWRTRQGGRASPVLLVVVFQTTGGERALVCGPAGDVPPVHGDFDLDRVERLCLAALDEPDRHAALRLVTGLLPEVGSSVPGLRNTGLLATHELVADVPTRSDWSSARRNAQPLLNKKGRALVEALGFGIDAMGAGASLLSVAGHPRAAAVFLDEDETFDLPAARLDNTTAVTHALRLADERGVPWVITTRGHQIRLYAARPDTGVGRKGRSETFVELNLAVLDPDDAGYLELLFSGRALAVDGTIEELLEHSEDFAADLGSRLRDRVYLEVVPPLATAVAGRMQSRNATLDDEDLADAYEQTLTILFRLLFVAYAEDKGLLPYGTHGRYQDHALKTIARRLTDAIRTGPLDFDEHATDLWDDLKHLWHAIDQGNTNWGVPQYNGGLFSDESDVNPVGSRLRDLELTNAEIGPPLAALLVDTDGDVIGPVDFRTLSVRDFGTIYEGLLESGLSISTDDLAVDAKGTYVPARAGRDVVEVEEGEIYFHNRSGARKATGSYFTKAFAVEHLLDEALEPAIIRHLEQVAELADSGEDAAAADLLFDFRCVDLAMGSGHFLVAAVDRIEARFSTFLATRPNWPAMVELERLRTKALDELAKLGDNFAAGTEIETSGLLRRQIARRCIYGIDRTSMAVELARLSLWVHTFVPGLPLSFLNHGLRQGNSLTGIGTIDEAVDAVDPEGDGKNRSLFAQPLLDALERARPALKKLGALSDLDRSDITQARNSQRKAEEVVVPVERLFDQIVAARLGEIDMPTGLNPASLGSARRIALSGAVAREVEAFHFPTAFPEVFLRNHPGFDCILGNPPWEKVKVEEHNFWGLRNPGLRALSAGHRREATRQLALTRPDLVAEYEREVELAQRLKQVLFRGPYPGISSGDPDLYKAFAWRFWQLAREGGAIGVVLPRSALAATGSSAWREEILSKGVFVDVTMTINTAGWVFDDAEPRYTIGFVSIRRSTEAERVISMRGPFASRAEYERGLQSEPLRFPVDDFVTWTNGAAFPLLPDARAGGVFLKLRQHPRLDLAGEWRARPVRELHASDDRDLYHVERNEGDWPVYKGESFELWNADTGVYLGWTHPTTVMTALQDKRPRQQRLARSAFSEFPAEWALDPDTLPCLRPRITFRDIGRATDTRTVIAALAPPGVVLTHLDPYFLWPDGDERDEAFLLGVLSSIPLDWYARRIVENHVSYQLLNAFPIPRPGRDNPIRRRVETIAGCLAAVDDRFEAWAVAAEVPLASVVEADEQEDLVAELDAAVALLYGLDSDDMRHLYETFHVGWDFEGRLNAVLGHYQRLYGRS